MFHLFRSGESTPIPGHKEQTQDLPITSFDPEFVYIPCVDSRGNPLINALEVSAAVKKGTLLGLRAPDDFLIYSSVSGTIEAKQERMTSAGRTRQCFVIHNDHKGEWDSLSPRKTADKTSVDEIVDAIKKSGVIGFGGAGFPTYRKFNSGKPCDALILNAVECEPYLTTDYVYGAEQCEYAFLAIPYLLKASGAKRVFFCTKKDKPALIDACEKWRKKYSSLPVELVLTKDAYPRGYERNLVTLVTGKEYEHIPIEAGCIVDNIYTFIALGRYFTQGKSADRRCVTVSGEVGKPMNILAPYGVLAEDVLSLAGFKAEDDLKIVNGGPRNGNVLSDGHYVLLQQADGITIRKKSSFRQEPCWHCGNCCEACPMDLQPVQIQMAYKAKDIQRRIELNADRCCGCGLCSYSCPSRIEVSQNVMAAKALVIQAKKEAKK